VLAASLYIFTIGFGTFDVPAEKATPLVFEDPLAGVYKKHGEFQKAIDVLKQLEAAGTYSKSAVAYELGNTAEAANQKDVAQEAYSKIIKDSPDSPFRADAETALKRMGLPIPAPTPEQVEAK